MLSKIPIKLSSQVDRLANVTIFADFQAQCLPMFAGSQIAFSGTLVLKHVVLQKEQSNYQLAV
jgi:hypothetical protein